MIIYIVLKDICLEMSCMSLSCMFVLYMHTHHLYIHIYASVKELAYNSLERLLWQMMIMCHKQEN